MSLTGSPTPIVGRWLRSALALILAACSSSSDSPNQPPHPPLPAKSVVVHPAVDTVAAYDTVNFTATALDSLGDTVTNPAIVWSSNSPPIADVDSLGVTITQAPGQVVISATVGAASGTAGLKILPPRVRTVLLFFPNGWSPPETRVPVRATEPYIAIAYDAKGIGVIPQMPAVWQSSDTGTISVQSLSPVQSNGGVVTAHAAGTATISATLDGVTSAGLVVTSYVIPTLKALTAGALHSCAIATDNAAYCWGVSNMGALGDGSDINRDGPVLVAGGHTWSMLAGGEGHTCGLTLAGVGYCWGNNDYGQLGIGSLSTSPVPAPVQGGQLFISISAGGNYTCAVTTSHETYCWGDNSVGQLGTGDSVDRTTPALVLSGLTIQSVGASGFSAPDVAQTCAVTTASAGYCWGSNADGQLGTGDSAGSAVPRLVGGAHLWSRITPGEFHSCGLDTNGGAFCWGANPYGAFGNGSLVSDPLPTAVSGGPYAEVYPGYLFGCAVEVGGGLACFGMNEGGQLGIVGPTQLESPANPEPGMQFSGVASGRYHSCALTIGGVAYCWGSGPATGADDLTSVPTPFKVVGQP